MRELLARTLSQARQGRRYSLILVVARGRRRAALSLVAPSGGSDQAHVGSRITELTMGSGVWLFADAGFWSGIC